VNRRGFLQLLAGSAAAAVAAAVAAPKVSYFFAPVGGWESDIILQADDFAPYFLWRIPYFHTPSLAAGPYLGCMPIAREEEFYPT
jgi:hypothetical protein